MLVGLLNYTKPDGKLFKYHLKATDNSSTCSLIISSHNYDALKYEVGVDVDDSDYNILDERRLNIGLSSVTLQTYVGQVNGKKTKSPVNNDFFCRLSALIRYAKSQCIKANELGYTGLQLASGDFEANPSSEYIIKFPMKDEIFANVTLTYGDITKLYLKTDDFEIDLYEDLSVETELFDKITDGLKLGFKIRSSEYLGFDVPKDSEKKFRTVNGMFTCIEDIVAAHPDKEFSWLLEKNYILVTDENLERICKYIREWDGYVYYDTETTGLKITFKSRIGQGDQLVGVVLSVKYGESFFFPCQMNNIPNLCNGDHFYFMEHYMRPILEGKKLVAHNMSFDWKVAYIYDINANIVHDTMALLKLTLGAEKVNYPIGLKYNAKVLLHRDSLELSDLLVNDDWGETDITFSDLPAELVRLYACADTDNTNGILQYALQNDLLGRYNAKKVYEIEIAFSYAVAYQEFYGHRINTENLAQVRETIGKGQADTMKQMVEIIGHEFNPNSPKQLISILYGELGIPEQISRKTGRPTTDKETLKKLAEITDIEDNIKYPFCGLLEKYREYEGVRKIIDKFPEYVTEDGYIFSEVQQYGTTTGRVSIKEPNYQSYNDPIKKNIIPRPGFWMFDTDYSSVEYRVLGNMVGNKKIMESFKDPDFDYHAYQAAHMYNVPYSAVTKKLRKAAKGINFGLPYGMGDESLGVRVFGDATPENTRKAAALRNAYFKGQEDIRDWFEYHRNRGVNEGFTETYFGRRRYYHRENFSIGAIRRQAGNQVIQGTAADIYKTAVGRVFKRICREGWLGKVIFTGFIHDELLGEVSNEINPAVWLKALREEFEVKVTNPDGSPWSPLYMGFGYGMSWYEAKSVELPIKLQWEIVDKYGEEGFKEWNGNGREFCDTIPDKLRDFEVRDIRNQLLDADSQNKEIKPTLNNQIIDCVKEDTKLYEKCIEKYASNRGYNLEELEKDEQSLSSWLYSNEKEILSDLDNECHIQSLYKEDGLYRLRVKPKTDTQDLITQFCRFHATDRDSINILNIAEYVANNKVDDNVEYYIESDEDEDEDKLAKIIDTKIQVLGMYLDVEKKKIICLLPSPERGRNVFLTELSKFINKTGDGYALVFRDYWEKPGDRATTSYISSKNLSIVQNLYLAYLGGKIL